MVRFTYILVFQRFFVLLFEVIYIRVIRVLIAFIVLGFEVILILYFVVFFGYLVFRLLVAIIRGNVEVLVSAYCM